MWYRPFRAQVVAVAPLFLFLPLRVLVWLAVPTHRPTTHDLCANLFHLYLFSFIHQNTDYSFIGSIGTSGASSRKG